MSKDGNIHSDIIFTDFIGQKGLDDARLLYTKRHKKNQLSTYDIHKVRAFLPTLLAYYNLELDRTNPAIFKFLNDSQRAALKDKLVFNYYLLYAQFQLDQAESRQHTLTDLKAKMTHCSKLLDALALAENTTTPEGQLNTATGESEKYLKFLGLTTIAPYVTYKTMEFIDSNEESFSSSKTRFIKDFIGVINGVRLYWVWAGGMLSAALDMLPDDFYNKKNAEKGIGAPAPITGYMSWVLYYIRYGVNLGLLLKHTIKGPWMTAEEAKIPAWERFTTQWGERKFVLINEFWAPANMAGFFWLRGNGTLGYIGNITTACLLLMDLTLTTWRFWEETTAFNKTIFWLEKAQKELKLALKEAETRHLTIQLELEKLRVKLTSLPKGQKDYEAARTTFQQLEIENQALALKKQELVHKIDDNEKVISKTKFDWKFKRRATINDLVYSAGLLIAFALMCCFFCPPALIAPATLMIITLAGATMSFVLTVATATITSGIEVSRFKQTSSRSKAECQVLLKQFKVTTDENAQKMIYLEMKALMADSVYQQRMARFQSIKLVHATLIDALAPAIIFTSLVFMPFGIGLAVLAAALVLAILSNIVLKQFEPKAAKLPAFDAQVEQEFQDFKAKTAQEPSSFEKNQAKKPGFFAPKANCSFLLADHSWDSPVAPSA